MVMRPTPGSQALAPSRNLLRFLRSQSDGLYSFSPKAAQGSPQCHGLKINYSKTDAPSRRHISSTSSNRTNKKPSYLDELWPRHCEPTPKIVPPPSQQHPPRWGRSIMPSTGTRHMWTGSSKEKGGFFHRLFAGRRSRIEDGEEKLAKDDLPSTGNAYDDPSTQLFNLARALSRHPSGADLKLRCTEFDANGSVTLVSGEFKKSELIAKYGLMPRDLRKIDSSVLPHILVRESSILINLLHLRVLIQCDRVLVFDAFGSMDTYTQSLFMYDLEGKLRQKADARSASNGNYLPYEFRALEAVLISVTQGLESEFEGVREPVVRVLRALEEDIDRDKLRHLLIHSKKLGTFEQKARLVRDAINDVLEADDDLSAMYLTERRNGHKRAETDHQEVEMLLESYHKVCDEIVEVSGNLISNIRNTEEVIRAILDANRNSLMLLDIKFSVGTLGLASGTLIAGLYGMNLENFIEESDVAFGGITAVCFGLSALVCVYGMRRLTKLQRVRMWGEGYGRNVDGGRGNWRNEAMEHAALFGDARADKIKKLKEMNGPVLWPGMEGLGVNHHRQPPSKVPGQDDALPVPKAEKKKLVIPWSSVHPETKSK